jgi:recombination associated protein RdgC
MFPAMWFHNLQIYRLPENWGLTAEALAEKLAARPFQPCGSQDMASRGWSSPTKDDRFVLAVGGHFLIALAVEQKLLPSSVVNEVAADKAEASRPAGLQARPQADEGDQGGGAAGAAARAFTRRKVLLDRPGGRLAGDRRRQPGPRRGILDALRDSLDELPVKMVKTQLSPVSVMTAWLAPTRPPATSPSTSTASCAPSPTRRPPCATCATPSTARTSRTTWPPASCRPAWR